MQTDPASWESMLDVMKANPEGTSVVCQKYGSHQIRRIGRRDVNGSD
jgi:hypothetical protein